MRVALSESMLRKMLFLFVALGAVACGAEGQADDTSTGALASPGDNDNRTQEIAEIDALVASLRPKKEGAELLACNRTTVTPPFVMINPDMGLYRPMIRAVREGEQVRAVFWEGVDDHGFKSKGDFFYEGGQLRYASVLKTQRGAWTDQYVYQLRDRAVIAYEGAGENKREVNGLRFDLPSKPEDVLDSCTTE